MLGCRSLQSELQPLDQEIEKTFRMIQFRNVAEPDEPNPPHQLKKYFTPSSYTYSPCIQVPPVEASQYEIKFSVIQMLPFFL